MSYAATQQTNPMNEATIEVTRPSISTVTIVTEPPPWAKGFIDPAQPIHQVPRTTSQAQVLSKTFCALFISPA